MQEEPYFQKNANISSVAEKLKEDVITLSFPRYSSLIVLKLNVIPDDTDCISIAIEKVAETIKPI